MKSIKTKIIITFTTLLFAVTGIITTFSLVRSQKALSAQTQNIMIDLAKQTSKTIEKVVEAQFNTLEVLAATNIINDRFVPINKKLELLSDEAARNNYISMGIVDLDGNMTSTDGSTSNIKDTEYFQKAVKGYKFVSDPTVNQTDQSSTITYALPIKQNNVITGILLATKDGKTLSDIISEATFGKNSSAYMINKNGVTVAHSNRELVINMNNNIEAAKKDSKYKSLAELEKKVASRSIGAGTYTYEGTKYYLAYSPVVGTNWSLAVTAPESRIMENSNNFRLLLVITIIIMLGLSIAASVFTAGQLSRPITAVTNHLKAIASGDFTTEVPAKYKKNKDETGSMLQSLEIMQNSLKQLIRGVVDASGKVTDSVSAAGKDMSILNSEVGKVSETIQELSANMEEMAASSEEMSASSAEIDKAVGSIASRAEDGASLISDINKRAHESGDNFMASMQRATSEFKKAKQSLELALEGSKNVNKIEELSGAILDIASRTNLLALNASIEATRAGEAGKGFAVVADKIRGLAEDSKKAINEIQNVTQIVTESVKNLSESSQKLLTLMSTDVLKDYNSMLATIEQYKKDSSEMDAMITDFSATSQELAASMENMVRAINEISAAAAESAGASGKIAESTNTAADRSDNVEKQVDISRQSAEKLNELVARFRV